VLCYEKIEVILLLGMLALDFCMAIAEKDRFITKLIEYAEYLTTDYDFLFIRIIAGIRHLFKERVVVKAPP